MSAPPKIPHPPKLLPQTFYSRSPETVARALLGKLLIRDLHGERLTGRITEVEAYLGLTNPASHAYRSLTLNNFPLFGPRFPLPFLEGHAFRHAIKSRVADATALPQAERSPEDEATELPSSTRHKILDSENRVYLQQLQNR
jgi:Methylpurine-DNA glycosylase (MPG)